MNIKKVVLFCVFLILIVAGYAYDPGDKVQDFTLTSVRDTIQINLHQYLENKQGVVLIFMSNNCPYSELYHERIIDLYNKFRDKGIQFLYINSNNPRLSPADGIKGMQNMANKKGIPFPYLADKNQKVARQFDVTKTPEAYVLDKQGEAFVLKYYGAIDDNAHLPSEVEETFLKDAIQAVIQNQHLSQQYRRPVGCILKDRM